MSISVDSFLALLVLTIEKSLFIWGLSYICWVSYRFNKFNGFGHIAGYSVPFLLIHYALSVNHIALGAVITVSGMLPFLVNKKIQKVVQGNLKNDLLPSLLIAIITLSAFNWLTNHETISLTTFSILKSLSIGLLLITLIFIFFWQSSKHGIITILGKPFEWAVRYWMGGRIIATPFTNLIEILCWYGVVLLPLSTTGIQGNDIVMNFAYAILISQINGAQQPLKMLYISLAVMGIIVFVDYFATVPVWATLIQLAILIVLIAWYQYRSPRASWENEY